LRVSRNVNAALRLYLLMGKKAGPKVTTVSMLTLNAAVNIVGIALTIGGGMKTMSKAAPAR